MGLCMTKRLHLGDRCLDEVESFRIVSVDGRVVDQQGFQVGERLGQDGHEKVGAVVGQVLDVAHLEEDRFKLANILSCAQFFFWSPTFTKINHSIREMAIRTYPAFVFVPGA
jgi:hypothetical protein